MTILFITHDIDESVYLGSRVLVLSSSPTIIQDDIVIDLPDERDQVGTRSLGRFAELRARVYEEVQFAKTNAGGVRGDRAA
jgi:NitT/TauT family transport system ATP-binding protein